EARLNHPAEADADAELGVHNGIARRIEDIAELIGSLAAQDVPPHHLGDGGDAEIGLVINQVAERAAPYEDIAGEVVGAGDGNEVEKFAFKEQARTQSLEIQEARFHVPVVPPQPQGGVAAGSVGAHLKSQHPRGLIDQSGLETELDVAETPVMFDRRAILEVDVHPANGNVHKA